VPQRKCRTLEIVMPKAPTTKRSQVTAILLAASVFVSLTTRGRTLQENLGTGQQQNPEQLIREVVANELKAQQTDRSMWRYTQTRHRGGTTEELAFVETSKGEIHRLLAQNGQPLTPEESSKEDARIEKLLASPQLFQQRARREEQDAQEEQHLLRMLPSALRYRNVGRENNWIKLDFTPNPSFKLQRREGEVFHHMQGTIWIDASQKRVARLTGRLTSEVKFGGGLLGHLAKGGTFVVEQKDVGDGHWELTQLKVNINGRALFFKTINVHHNEQDSDFTPVPSDISLQEAAKLLKQVASREAASLDPTWN
jgi:hypothetical protein